MSYSAAPTIPKRDGFASAAPDAVTVDMTESPAGGAVTINDDGSVEIKPLAPPRNRAADRFGANLAAELGSRGALGAEIAEGVDADIASRREFIEQYAEGMQLLGLKIEKSSAVKGAKTNVSQVRHPILLESVIKAQSAAQGELMPAAGPCKVQVVGGESAELDQMASDLESDINVYLTKTASEYYPDFDRGLFGFFFSGNLFKKVYMHPVRRRPVSECIAVEDLIVSEDAADLDTALRVTHRSEVTRPTMTRMQRSGAWLDIDLVSPMSGIDPAKQAKDDLMGISPVQTRPLDMPWTIYETTTDLVLADWGWADPKAPDDMPVPYIVTIEKDTQAVLAVRRGWRDGDPQYQRRGRFVHYGMTPAFGLLCLGFVHLLGNQTKVLTAIWQLLVDSCMFASFPGGVKAKGVRTDTNEIQPSPGQFMDVDIGPFDDIRKAFMTMPYRDPSAVFVQLSEIIGQDAQRLGGAVELEVGEGRTNVPVGTMMSMIEQATQVMASVHKRMHRAQARELQLLKECFADHPETLSLLNPKPARQWTDGAVFANLNLIPQSDPNVPSQIHRIQMATALVQVASANPQIYDIYAVHQRVWRQVGISDAESFMHPPAAPGAMPPDPKAQAAMLTAIAKNKEVAVKEQQLAADIRGDQTKAQSEALENQRKAAAEEVDNQQQLQSSAMEAQSDQAAQASKQKIADDQIAIEKLRLETEERRAERQEETARAALQLEELKMRHQMVQDQSGFGGNGGMHDRTKRRPK